VYVATQIWGADKSADFGVFKRSRIAKSCFCPVKHRQHFPALVAHMSAPWVDNALEWLAQQPGRTSGKQNVNACQRVWLKLASGKGVSSPNRPGDNFCDGVCVDPNVHNITHLYSQSREWLHPNKPSVVTGRVKGRIYDSGRGWGVNTQLMHLQRYCKDSEIDCKSKIFIAKPFKGDPNSLLTKRASDNATEWLTQQSRTR
jgi:hypothetical protein